MKKIIVTSYILSSLLATSAYSEQNNNLSNKSIELGGSFDFNFANRTQSSNYKDYLTTNVKNSKFNSKARLTTSMENTSDTGLKYGLHLVLDVVSQMDNNTAYRAGFNRSYIYLEDYNTGKLELGGNESPSNALSFYPDSVSPFSDDVFNNAWWNYVAAIPSSDTTGYSDIPYYSLQTQAILAPRSYFNRHPSYFNSRKIAVYSPQINGFQLGVSYAPDMANHGDNLATNGLPKIKNAFSTGLTYTQELQKDTTLSLSAVYDRGHHTGNTTRNINSYMVSGKLQFNDLSFLASYGSDGKSMTLREVEKFKSYFYSGGIAYEKENLLTSLSYTNTKVGGQEYNSLHNNNIPRLVDVGTLSTSMLSLGASYKLAKGLKPYAEVDFYRLKYSKDNNLNKKINNKGTIILAGLKVIL